jgi:xanthine dehydrogenase accessory factor
MSQPDPNCAVAHGHDPAAEPAGRLLVAVFASPVAAYLVRYGTDLGFRTVLVEPDAARRLDGAPSPGSPRPHVTARSFAEVQRLLADGTADVVVTDHHRDELGELLRDALAGPARWIGVMGNPRHEGPHVAALTALGVPAEEIARVHRPIGLDIGSRTPPEIAISTLAGLLADRSGRSGGFAHGG